MGRLHGRGRAGTARRGSSAGRLLLLLALALGDLVRAQVAGGLVEHGVLMIGVSELTHCLDIPYRVAVNEAVELAKTFGGTDGHKYVNAVLDKAAGDLRPHEVAERKRQQQQQSAG